MPVRGSGPSHRVRGYAAVLALAVLVSGCEHAGGNRKANPATASSATARVSGPAKQSTGGARTVTVLGSGDVLIHPALWEQAAADAREQGRTGYDFGPIYAGVAPVTREVDLATCELETPLAPPEGPFAGWPNFNAPPQVLTALKAAGYDSCTTASNHTLDQGYPGVERTLDELDAAGLRHTGSARSAAEAAQPLILATGNGVRIAQLAFSFGFNGIALPAAQPWLANSIDLPAILAAAHRAKQAGADIVVLSMHWGTEYDHDPTAEQASQADQLLASPDIDVILGDHAHVVQPFQKLHGKWVAYCMGNQISRHEVPSEESREGVMPRFTFTESAPHHFVVTKAEAIPTWMEISPRLRLIHLQSAIADPQTAADVRAGYQAALARITGYLDSLDARRDGLIVG
ncbi:MAG TPA: CapA family protein [Jatrophihabitans sp.]|nr:CapA family protein [Jatrophihabitans sp.]